MSSRFAVHFAIVSAMSAVVSCDSEDTCAEGPDITCVWAGTGRAGFNGDGLALGKSKLYWPVDVTFAANGDAYVLDWNNHRVRRVDERGTFETVIGTDFVGDGDPVTADLVEPGVLGTEVDLNHPTQLLELHDGKFLLIAWHNHKLRHYDPDTGLVYVLCGRGAGFDGDDGPATAEATRLNQPAAAVLGSDGTLYVLDQRNERIRRIGPDGIISSIAGTGEVGFAGDGGDPMLASFNFPKSSNPPPAGTLALDDEGRLYIADTLNHRIRRIDFTSNVIDTVVGNGDATFAGDGGPATQASINNPRDITVGPDGRLYIADELNHRVRAVDLDSGVITTVMGTGEAVDGKDGLAPERTALHRPSGVSFDGDGWLYVADTYNHKIRRVLLEEVAK